MISVKELHMQQTVNAALAYLKGRGSDGELSKRFNQLCKEWHADAYNPEELSLDVDDIAMCIDEEPWIRDIAALPASERTWQDERASGGGVYRKVLCHEEGGGDFKERGRRAAGGRSAQPPSYPGATRGNRVYQPHTDKSRPPLPR